MSREYKVHNTCDYCGQREIISGLAESIKKSTVKPIVVTFNGRKFSADLCPECMAEATTELEDLTITYNLKEEI